MGESKTSRAIPCWCFLWLFWILIFSSNSFEIFETGISVRVSSGLLYVYLVPIYFHVWKLKLFHQSISMTWFLQRKDRTMVPSNNTKVKWRNRTKHIFTFFSFPKRYAMQYKVVCTFTEMQIWTKIWNYVQQKLGGGIHKNYKYTERLPGWNCISC